LRPRGDAQALTSLGFDVVATDLLPRQLARARERGGTGSLLRIDHCFPLPFREHSFDLVLASLSPHYFPWGVMLAVFDETIACSSLVHDCSSA
jgi:hypothetical protein